MTKSSPSSGIGRLTSFAITLLVLVCLTLIGFSGYLKFQIDKAEALLAAPETAFAAGEDAPQKLRRALGYSGFLTAAQTFLATRDTGALADMKAQIKNAQDVLARLPQKTPPEARHDLQSIIDVFAAAAKKAEQSVTDTSLSFNASDLAPLYAALPVLDERMDAAISTGRFAAQADLKLWATLLTLIAWGSLVLAAVCAVCFYLALRGRNAAPFRALAQSVQNMARGDMRTPIWGMERQDMIGDLARAIDLARYHFSQLPDMSLLTEQGPMRIRFEGQARSLFEVMMQNIAKDSESIRSQSGNLADSVNKQKDAVAQVVASIEGALGNMYHERRNSEQQVQQLLQSVGHSAQSLKGAQETAEAQLNYLISYLEERAKGMAEVTQITGKQVAQTLQSLSNTEFSLRASAEQNQQTVKKLALSTDELGERLFGAVSLLRAGGKVLTETAENTQGRLNEAISLLSQSEGSLRQMLIQGFEPIGQQLQITGGNPVPAARAEENERLQSIVAGLEGAQRKLEECLSQQTQAAGAQIDMLTTRTQNLLDQVGERLEQRMMEQMGRAELSLQGISRLSGLAEQFGGMVEKLSSHEPARDGAEIPGNLVTELKTGFEITNRSIARLREEFVGHALTQPVSALPALTPAAPAPEPVSLEPIINQIMEANSQLAHTINEQASRVDTRLAAIDEKLSTAPTGVMSPDEAQTQLQQQAQVLAELASALGAIDAHMQEMRSAFHERNNGNNGNNGRDQMRRSS